MISSELTRVLAQANADSFRHAADRRRLARAEAERPQPLTREPSVTLRFGSTGDEQSLARLAALDSGASPKQPVLLAEVDGRLLAAISLSDGSVIADPFQRTAEVIDLLCARARQLDSPTRRHRGRLRARLRWVFDL